MRSSETIRAFYVPVYVTVWMCGNVTVKPITWYNYYSQLNKKVFMQ